MGYGTSWTSSVVDIMQTTQYVGIIFLCLGSAAMTLGLMLVEGNMNNNQAYKSTTIFAVASIAWAFILLGIEALRI